MGAFASTAIGAAAGRGATGATAAAGVGTGAVSDCIAAPGFADTFFLGAGVGEALVGALGEALAGALDEATAGVDSFGAAVFVRPAGASEAVAAAFVLVGAFGVVAFLAAGVDVALALAADVASDLAPDLVPDLISDLVSDLAGAVVALPAAFAGTFAFASVAGFELEVPVVAVAFLPVAFFVGAFGAVAFLEAAFLVTVFFAAIVGTNARLQARAMRADQLPGRAVAADRSR